MFSLLAGVVVVTGSVSNILLFPMVWVRGAALSSPGIVPTSSFRSRLLGIYALAIIWVCCPPETPSGILLLPDLWGFQAC